jgi:hypothetical protein
MYSNRIDPLKRPRRGGKRTGMCLPPRPARGGLGALRGGLTARARAQACCWLTVLPLLGGCYRYTPVEMSAVQPGENVRVHVGAREADRIAPALGGVPARRFEGVLVQTDAANLLLQIPSGQRMTGGGGIEVLSQQVTVARDGVVGFELKRLDRTRTGVLVGLGVAVAGTAVAALFRGSRRDGEPGEFEVPDFWRPIAVPHRGR